MAAERGVGAVQSGALHTDEAGPEPSGHRQPMLPGTRHHVAGQRPGRCGSRRQRNLNPAAGLLSLCHTASASSEASWRCVVRGNPVRVRNCPAAVCRNERRQQHWSAQILDWEATATRNPARLLNGPIGSLARSAGQSTSRCAPASPKTCQLRRARRVRRLIASWNGRLAAPVAVVHCGWIGCASAGGDHTVD